ncbi:MAG: alkaline shock response membrane anchor protein AmaP [Thermoflavifilum sp.]|nr:alkaline shock response membrane anchor protein AmaP [Thermoflavifilum sp.]MCL6514013.1 alkaline shock response membrane anchor protein AmaP [Alicyclobacillus sp.]
MTVLDRLLLVLLALAGVIAGVGAILLGVAATGGAPPAWLLSVLVPGTAVYWWIGGVISVLLGLRFLAYRLRAAEPEHVSLSGEHGQIRISYETLRQLAVRAGRGIKGVHEFDARVRMGQAGLVFYTRVRAHPDTDLAQMSRDVQTAVKQYVERTAGVAVERVIVQVADIAGSAPRSARAWVE